MNKRKYFGTDDPMGKVITIVEEKNTFTVTGVIKDVPKNSIFVSIPFDIATSAVFLVGSIPKTGIFRSLKY